MPTQAATRTLTLLHLEDSEDDHDLLVATLLRGGLRFNITRVDGERAFDAALAQRWDAILSDYHLPGYTGLDALAAVRGRRLSVPFLLISGEIGEDVAVDAMRQGASDYLLKHNLKRLAPALMRAIEAAEAEAERAQAQAALAQSRQQLSQLAQHLQTSVEAERAAIAREIHDDVGGSLTALKFDLAWIERRSDDGEVRQRVRSALETVTHAIDASQRIMHNLRPAILEQGLVAALQWLTQRFEKRTGIATVFRTSHDGARLPPLPALLPLVAYRTAQEALTNVSKHAGARRVSVDLSLSAGVLSVEVSDDGQGLTDEDLAKVRSFGIRGLHERAATVGGWVDISSGPEGTTLILSVPLEEAGAADSNGAGRAAERADAATAHDPHDPSGWGDL